MSAGEARLAIALVAAACLAVALSPVATAGDWPPHPGAVSAADIAADGIIYQQPPSAAGGLHQSSRNGSDYDRYVWDSFIVGAGQAFTITQVQWRGGYLPDHSGSGGPALDFTISIYRSIPGGSQPDVINPPLAEYLTGGAAGESYVGMAGNARMYDYTFVLPTAFNVTGPQKYWLLVEATQGGIPDWGIAVGAGPDARHFLGMPIAGDMSYFIVGDDVAFTLRGSGAAPAQNRMYAPLIAR